MVWPHKPEVGGFFWFKSQQIWGNFWIFKKYLCKLQFGNKPQLGKKNYWKRTIWSGGWSVSIFYHLKRTIRHFFPNWQNSVHIATLLLRVLHNLNSLIRLFSIINGEMSMFVYLSIGGSRGRAGHTPPYGTQFFHFHIHFCQKVPTLEVHTPPNGSTPPPYGKSWIRHC